MEDQEIFELDLMNEKAQQKEMADRKANVSRNAQFSDMVLVTFLSYANFITADCRLEYRHPIESYCKVGCINQHSKSTWNWDFPWYKMLSILRESPCPGHIELSSVNQPSFMPAAAVPSHKRHQCKPPAYKVENKEKVGAVEGGELHCPSHNQLTICLPSAFRQ